jgi:DNA-binding FadR family transcriptional regulator
LLRANEATPGDLEEFARTDDDFHFGVARISHNSLVTALYNSVLAVLENQRHTSLKHPEALEAAIACHRRIFEAIAARDPDRAEMEMRRHLGDVETYYWSVRRDRAVPPKSSPDLNGDT